MTRRTSLEHRYVEFIPRDLDEGIVYISERFKTASHLCCCGCGNKVATPLNPAKWRLVDHGDSISLSPSIGLGIFPCRSHYWIRRSRVDWAANMTDGQTARAQRADSYADKVFTGEIKPVPPLPAPKPQTVETKARASFGARLKVWWQSLWR